MVFVTFFFLLFSTISFAGSEIVARVHSIDRGLNGEETLFFLTSGDVVRSRDQNISGKLENALTEKVRLRFSLSEDRSIESIQEESPLYQNNNNNNNKKLLSIPVQETYIPTQVENMEVAMGYFREAKSITSESECFNRAHIWSYEWFINNGVNSNKTWIFFTRQYIRKFKFKWWFHVAPSLQVLVNGFLREKVLDVKYSRGPIDIKSWSDIFMKNKASCQFVTVYSDYANYPESASCYIMNTSMFYYQPFDIESRETWGTIKANWYDPEVQQAYTDALDEAQ